MKIASITFAGKADVFNMEVEDTHNYVVNGGFVAHNCYDATRYFLMDHPITATRKHPRKQPVYDPLDMQDEWDS